MPLAKRTRRLPVDVVADLADGPDRVLQREVAHRHAGLDHPQHQVGRADLEHRGDLVDVRVADDDVQAPVALGVGVRLVAGVDDRARPRGRGGDALPDVLGALRQAEARAARGLQDLPGPADQLAGDEERDEDLGEAAELAVAADEVVLVAAVGVPGGVGVVLEQVDVAGDALVVEALLGVDHEAFEDALAGPVVFDQVLDRVALGGGVLGVGADVEVEAGAVAEEHVGGAAPGDHSPEEVAGHFVRRQAALSPEGASDPVFGLQSENAPVHVETLPRFG